MTGGLAQVAAPFVTPALAWAGLAMVSVPVTIHLLSRWRRRPQPWGAMRFLLEAYRKHKRRMHLEQWLLLLLRCLIVLLLGLALARPRLVGTLGAWLSGLDTTGRVVNLLIDDSMTLQAPDHFDTTRFDRLMELADAVVEQLEPTDRVTVWRTGRPAEPVIAQPTPDHAAVRRALASLTPGYTRSDWPGALQQLAQWQARNPDPAGRVLTFVLSDQARSGVELDQPMSTPSLAGELFIARPFVGTDNIQMTEIIPERRVVWFGEDARANVPVVVRVSRYTRDLIVTTVPLLVQLSEPDGRVIAETRRRVSFAPGQQETRMSVDLPISRSSMRFSDQSSGVLITIRARIEADQDSLPADNGDLSTVILRQRMRVGVVDTPVGLGVTEESGLMPGQWVRLALNPSVTNGVGPVEVKTLTPERLNDPQALVTHDAVMVLRPDSLSQTAWDHLHTFAEAGGLVWVIPPGKEGSTPWINDLLDTFNPDWRIDLEPVVVESEDTGMGLVGGPLRVLPLQRLTADWQALTRPVRVYRYFSMSAPEGEAWMKLATELLPAPASMEQADTTQKQSNVLLAHHRVGHGSLLWLSTAVDTRWTNLPTKPLFVPLIHETLHGSLGLAPQPTLIDVRTGDRPDLNAMWESPLILDRVRFTDDPIDTHEDTVQVTRSDETRQPLGEVVTVPGLYEAVTDDGPRRLIAHIDPAAGDTRPMDIDALTRWLDASGFSWQWLDERRLTEVLGHAEEQADIGWALLWAVLALVLIETALARRFSHAHAEATQSLTRQVWHTAMRWRRGDHADDDRGKAA
ncbi:MAG: hypothetical protein Kow00105_18250 [Phycisphaeraceae bacterium]